MLAPLDDTARRLQEISTLLRIARNMASELNRWPAIAHIRKAVQSLANVSDDDHSVQSRIVRYLMSLAGDLSNLGVNATNEQKWSVHIEHVLFAIEFIIQPSPVYALQLTSVTDLKGNPVAQSIVLPLDKIYTFTITEKKADGTFSPIDASDVFQVTCDNAELNVQVAKNAAGNPAITTNWLHSVTPRLTGVSVVVTDSLGNIRSADLFDMGEPTKLPDQIGLDVTNIEIADQPIPPNAV